MSKISRVGDRTIGTCTHPPTIQHPIPSTPIGGTITTGAANSTVEGIPAARVGDIVTADCGFIGIINTGAVLTLEGAPVARIGDTFIGVYSGTIVTGCSETDAQ